MADIADSIIEGEICEQCGEYLGEALGYPALCGSCESEQEDDEQKEKSSRLKLKPKKRQRRKKKKRDVSK